MKRFSELSEGVSPTAFWIMVTLCLVVLPVVAGLWISGPEDVQRSMRDAAKGGWKLLRRLFRLALAVGAIFLLVRLVRLAWRGL
jgi:hypothetical protein